MSEYVFVIYSCKKHLTQCETIYNRIHGKINNTSCYILYGDTTLSRDYEIIDHKYLVVNVEDDYDNLSHKTIKLINAINVLFPYTKGLFKCDDDVIVNISNINTFIKTNTHDYCGVYSTYNLNDEQVGHLLKNRDNHIFFNTEYCAGPLYFLSKSALSTFIDCNIKINFNEDVTVGFHLKQKGILPTYTNLYTNVVQESPTTSFHNSKHINDLNLVIQGGLGNQLFQIASALKFAQKYNKQVKINKSLIVPNPHQNRNIDITYNTLSNILPFMEKCDHKLYLSDFYKADENKYDCFTYTDYVDKCMYTYNNVLLNGYFINYKYIPDNFYELVKPQLLTNVLNYDFNHTYFIHVRLGDYLKHDIYQIDLQNYYNYSINSILNQDASAKFIVCTNQHDDALNKVLDAFPDGTNYIIQDKVDTDIDTLCLMSSCCGGICSNSTLSYMGAYFQTNKQSSKLFFPYPYVKFSEGWTKKNLPIDMYPPWCTIYNTLNDSIIENINGETISILNKKNVFYINLEHRTDRREHVERELSELGWEFARFNAIKLPNNPALGCTLSHLKILEHAKSKNLDYVIIVEDDICFTNKKLFLENFNKILESGKEFDVCILSGNLLPPYRPFLHNCAIQVSHSQTTTGYMVKKHYYDTLINNIKTGAALLLRHPMEKHKYAIDMYWIQLQKTDTWVITIPLTVTQMESYSDIERRDVNYTQLMLNEKQIINGRIYLK